MPGVCLHQREKGRQTQRWQRDGEGEQSDFLPTSFLSFFLLHLRIYQEFQAFIADMDYTEFDASHF